MPRLTVAFITAHRTWGGVKSWILIFGQALVEGGDRVLLYAADRRLVKRANDMGIAAQQLRFGIDYNPGKIWWFRRELQRQQVDVAVMNIFKELRCAGVAAQWLGIPVVQRIGLVSDLSSRDWRQRLDHAFTVDRVLVPGTEMRREILRTHPWVHAQRITAISNGRRLAAAPRCQPNRPLRLVMGSRLERHKGHEHVLQAIAGLATEFRLQLQLDILGAGTYHDALVTQSRALGLSGSVRFLGFQEDIQSRLARYDVGILASDKEGLPNTVLEYLAASLPVLATRVGGVGELLRHGHNGFLYDYGDTAALQGYLRHLLEIDNRRFSALSAAAYQTVRSDFYLPDKVRELHDFLTSTVREKAGSRTVNRPADSMLP